MNYSKFELFGTTHLLILLFTLTLIIFIILLSKYNFQFISVLGKIIISIIILSIIIKLLYNNIYYKLTLPMHLCDWAAIAVIITFFIKNHLTFELAYFWGLSGTLQALLTPDIGYTFPHVSFFTFFLMHIGIIAAIFYFIFFWKLYPKKGAVKRIFFISQLYIIIAMIFNCLLRTNYGFLINKPAKASILDYLGPWPVYILFMEVLGLLLMCILYLPFYKKRNKSF